MEIYKMLFGHERSSNSYVFEYENLIECVINKDVIEDVFLREIINYGYAVITYGDHYYDSYKVYLDKNHENTYTCNLKCILKNYLRVQKLKELNESI